jgi:hypothetical protein
LNKPNHTRRPHFQPRSPAGLLLLGAGLLLLLGLVAAVSRAHHTPGGHAGIHSPPSGVGDYVFSIFLMLVVGLTIFLLWLWFSERDMLAQQRQPRRGSLRAFAFLAIFAVIAVGLSHVRALRNLRKHSPLAKINPGKRAKVLTDAQKAKGEEQPPEFKWLPVFIATGASMAVLGVIGVRSVRRSRRGLVEGFLLEQEFEGLVEDTLADLYAETDPRKAIIAAYARVERLFGSYGIPRELSEAPVEYLERALPELRASGTALRRLTALFAWAKFSAHDVDRSMRDEAIGALVEVRNELRALRIEDEQKREELGIRPVDRKTGGYPAPGESVGQQFPIP